MRAYLFILITGFILGIFACSLFTCNRPAPPQAAAPIATHSDSSSILLPSTTSQWHTGAAPTITVVQGGQIWHATTIGPPRTDSVYLFEYLPADSVDTAAIIAHYKATNFYQDTFHLGGGVVKVETEITENMLQKQRATLDSFAQKVITNTITVAVQRPPRSQLFLGFNVQGNATSLLAGAGPSLLFKTTRDKIIEAGAILRPDAPVIYQAGIKLPLFH